LQLPAFREQWPCGPPLLKFLLSGTNPTKTKHSRIAFSRAAMLSKISTMASSHRQIGGAHSAWRRPFASIYPPIRIDTGGGVHNALQLLIGPGEHGNQLAPKCRPRASRSGGARFSMQNARRAVGRDVGQKAAA
jgi:hypothetical protein